jgi:hypothetical protein
MIMAGTGRDRIRIGNGAGFWGDNLDAPVRLVEKGGLDYLTLEYLAELTLSILAHQRKRDPQSGYVNDFTVVLASLIPYLKSQPGLRIITNAGGLNPEACAREASRILLEAGLGKVKVAWIDGDDLMPRLPELLQAGEPFLHFDSQASSGDIQERLVSANAYLGAAPISRALDLGARIVITGRIADASLTVGPAMHEFGWDWRDWDLLAMATMAGHLIECGAQVTGGLMSRWDTVKDYANIGYPIAELNSSGGCQITKPAGTGGRVDCDGVAEQLLYEIGDPTNYLTPDVTLDISNVELEDGGKDVVKVIGAKGRPPPKTLKVSCAFTNGFAAKGDLVICGRDAVKKAEACGKMILDRVAVSGVTLEKKSVEVLGSGACLPGVIVDSSHLQEVVLRVSVWDPSQRSVDRFCRELSPIITSGPPGITGYAGSRPRSRPVLSYWPTNISRENVRGKVHVNAAEEIP